MRQRLGILLALAVAGCALDGGDPDQPIEPTNPTPPPVTCSNSGAAVDDGATVAYTAGVDAGYYVEYLGAGRWHLEWTCDTKLSAYGCSFEGTVTADLPPSGMNATCYQCEAADQVSVKASSVSGPTGEAQMIIGWDTSTFGAVDGLDFTTTPGSPITVDLRIDGQYQPGLDFWVQGGKLTSPTCGGVFNLAPSAP